MIVALDFVRVIIVLRNFASVFRPTWLYIYINLSTIMLHNIGIPEIRLGCGENKRIGGDRSKRGNKRENNNGEKLILAEMANLFE